MKKLLIFLSFLAISTILFAQDFEIRTQEDPSTNFIQVRIRNTQKTWLPNNSTTVDSVNFVICWAKNSGDVVCDIELVCSDYNIIDRYNSLFETSDDMYNHRFFTTSSSFLCPQIWDRRTWYTIATFRAVNTGYSGSLEFYIGENGWLTDPAANPVWAQNNTQIDPMDVPNNGHDNIPIPSVYTFTWVGGGDDTYDPDYDAWSWNNPLNWVNMCGRQETRSPDTYAYCIIPDLGTGDVYPKYSKQGNLAYKETALSFSTTVKNGGEINWTGAAIPNDTVSTLWVDGPFTIEDGGYVNIGYYGMIRTVNFDDGYYFSTYVEGSNGLDIDYFGWLQTGDLDINAADGATVASHGWLEVYGVPYLDQQNALTIGADATGVGNFVNPNRNMQQTGGSSVVQTYISNSANVGDYYLHMVGPTVNDTDFEDEYSEMGVYLRAFDLDLHGTFAYLYDEPTNDWLNIWPYEHPVPTTTGMMLSTRDQTDYIMQLEGKLLENTISADIQYTLTGGQFALISNPYPSSIDWEYMYFGNSGIGNVVRVFDPSDGAGSYLTYQAGGIGTGNFNGYIQVGQAFFIESRPTTTGSFNFYDWFRLVTDEPFFSPTSKISPSRNQFPVNSTQQGEINAAKVSSNVNIIELNERSADFQPSVELYSKIYSSRSDDLKDSKKKLNPFPEAIRPIENNREIINVLNVAASGNNFSDELVIVFRDDALKGYDEFDANKWASPHLDATEISTLNDENIELTINSLPFDQNEMLSIPVRFKCGANETYTLEFKGLDSFDPSNEIWLQDNMQENDWINITTENNIYEFNASPDDPNDRFTIHFFGPTGIDDKVSSDQNTVNIYSSGNNLYVLSDIEETINEIVIYNILGSEITHVNNVSRSINKLMINAASGYYVVRVLTDKNVYSEKVFIKN